MGVDLSYIHYFLEDMFEQDSPEEQPEQPVFAINQERNWFESVCKSIEILGRIEEIIWLQRGTTTEEF